MQKNQKQKQMFEQLIFFISHLNFKVEFPDFFRFSIFQKFKIQIKLKGRLTS